ncbi:bifunctional phosphoglucose/phosphomannose isomerase [Heliobacterium gestii]|uniref:Bifunctional phosphoglucose/phosphomannose isomerase n=1 Tax=Heliomicrobium gestii TaxID=2699 RepID=A0A845LCQ9_HELGE|nr:bifunctional phosphoglucose/phosphomannose isomerase [Heliomicrobium gestii]MBM7868444.1 glucose/mannose-6-phosphate isomerase [Heliomicrobium gestii]MZP44617.1 bifunctional phosphoglucose/phosphomannose isomerase [Heliomicrobium gestii]
MIDLNDVQKIRELDSMGSLVTTEHYAEQFAEGLALAQAFGLDNPGRAFHEILMLGTGGGSSVSGGLLRSYLFDELPLPLAINQGYHVPAYVDANTLVFVISHSGNTEEILSAYDQAVERGAFCVAVTAGGKLADRCRRDGVPYLIVPPDIGHPRRDLGYIFIPLLVILGKLGIIEDKRADIEGVIDCFAALKQRYGADCPIGDNLAKQIAIDLQGYIPLVYGSLDYYDAVAWRIKNQFGENSKLMAFYNVIPNLHHDEAVGWDMPQELLSRFYLLMLRDREADSEKLAKRKDISRDILRDRMGKVTELHAEGQGRLARMFSLVYLGDFISLYAPICRGVDPTPVDVINLFKKKMAE